MVYSKKTITKVKTKLYLDDTERLYIKAVIDLCKKIQNEADPLDDYLQETLCYEIIKKLNELSDNYENEIIL